jgi:multimeric flavodoxin WrbA
LLGGILPVKVVAFNGSPRVKGNTFNALNIVLGELQKEGIETELVQLGGRKVFGCLACYKCFQNKNK